MIGVGVGVKYRDSVRDRFMNYPTAQCVPGNSVNTGEKKRMMGHHEIRLYIYRLVDYFDCRIECEEHPFDAGRGIPADQTNTVPRVRAFRWKVTVE
jgi:hypothetical protein